jgi:hypothetical protein
MRKKNVLLIVACVFLAVLAFALCWPLKAFLPSSLGVSFLGYTNGTQAVFRITNPSSDTLQLAPRCTLMTEQWRPLGSVPLAASSGGPLRPRSADIITVSRPPAIRWRAQFYAEPVGLRRRWHQMRMAAHRVGLPVRNPGMRSLGGPSEIIEP